MQQLRRSGVLATLEARHRQALDGPWADVECLARWREDAIARRAHKPLALRGRRAALNPTKTVEGFDGRVTPTITRHQVRPLASWEASRQKRHVVIWGPPGVGTRHRAHALAHDACRQGGDGLVVHPHKRRHHLHGGRADGTWTQRLSGYLRPELLVRDAFGLKPLVAPAPSDLADVINERDETGSSLVTSTRAPTEWPHLVGPPLRTSAGLERRAQHAETLGRPGRSFRAPGRQLAEQPPPEPAPERR